MALREALERARPVKLLILDVDGVMTDGTLYYSPRGEELKAFNIQDGHGIRMLLQSGVNIAIVSGRSSRAVRLRAANLGIRHVLQGIDDKRTALATLLKRLRVSAQQAGCMGDDLPDLPLMTRCGFAASVPAAPQEVRRRAHYVSRAAGGRGAVREVCELIMRAQGSLKGALDGYLK